MERRHNLVIIDSDLEYLNKIKEDLIRRYADRVDLQIITDPDYLREYLETPKKIDVLMIDENDYRDGMFDGHSVRASFLMLQEIIIDKELPEGMHSMMKYLPVEEIYKLINDVFARIDLESVAPENKNSTQTKVIGVYSPVGGCGKSLISIGLCRKLKMLDQKVLLVGCDDLQSFSAFYRIKDFADDDLAREMKHPTEDLYWTILKNIETDEFPYLKPFRRVPHALGIGRTQWSTFLALMREKKDFDVIVLDIGSRVDEAGVTLMDRADEIILVTETTVTSMRKMERIVSDGDMLPSKKCLLLSNQYHSDGARYEKDTIFDTLPAYVDWRDAIEDPVFYRLAMSISDDIAKEESRGDTGETKEEDSVRQDTAPIPEA